MRTLFSFLGALWPSRLRTKEQVLHWRYAVAISLMLLMFSTGFAYTFSLGYVPGFGGFAMAEANQAVAQKLDNIQMRALDNQLLDMRVRQCKAISDQNSAAMGFAARNMQMLRSQWIKLEGQPWQTPACEELI